MIGESEFHDFLKFSEYIHGETTKYQTNSFSKTNKKNYVSKDKPLWSGNGIDIYDGNNVEKCIEYTQGGLTGQYYSFCIGQPEPSKNMFRSYRDNHVSTFYYIVDRNRFVTNDDGSVNLEDPLHIVVFDRNRYDLQLTDARNKTGSLFNMSKQDYLSYLESKGVPMNMLVNKPKTEEERKEDSLLGITQSNLSWFMGLSTEMKYKYIGRGHPLTDEQFDYLMGAVVN